MPAVRTSADASWTASPVAPVWTAGRVARHLGVSESTLRTWHRRYGLAPVAATAGAHRRYTAADVTRLARMRELIGAGVLPSDAARMVGSAVATSDTTDRNGTDPDTADLVDALATAAAALDSDRCLGLLERLLAREGVVLAWERVCRPALHTVTAGQVDPAGDADACVDREHVLSWAIQTALHRVTRAPTARSAPRVLVACAPGEQHTLPMEALAAALGERAVPVRMLGAATPVSALRHAVASCQPAAVLVWSQRRDTAHPAALRGIADHPARQRAARRAGSRTTDAADDDGGRVVISAGPGWGRRSRAGVVHAESLPHSLELLAPLIQRASRSRRNR